MKSGANLVRIIGGRHRGRKLHFVPGRGLRPTADRVRETLFNWLQAEVRGSRCLDLFAGSGALGFEALSRGADSIVLVEQARAAADRLRENLSRLDEERRAEVVQVDARRFLQGRVARPFDIVFLDPPFAAGLLAESAAALEDRGWLSPGAYLYVEQDASHDWPELPPSWRVHRQGKAGQAAFRLYRRG